jgi:hypothetical protein
MSRFAKVTVLVLVLALLVMGLPVGMPMGAGTICPQCVLPAGLVCVLAVLLSFAVVAPKRSGGRVSMAVGTSRWVATRTPSPWPSELPAGGRWSSR